MIILVGQQVQASPPYFGLWTGDPTAFTFQWQDSLDGVSLHGDISGETRSDYIATSGEIGRYLRVEVIGSNAGGDSDPAYSDWFGPVGETVEPEPTPYHFPEPRRRSRATSW